MRIYTISEVFNESDTPVITFVRPKEFQDLVGSLLTSGKHVTLSGPSGCGKTTLAKKALESAKLGPGQTHWTSGRDFRTATRLREFLSLALTCDLDESAITENLQLAGVLIIDDFHHLDPTVRKEIASSLKRWNEIGIRLLVIGIAGSNKVLVDVDPELGIRHDPYEMKTQDEDFCSAILRLGETALNISFSDATRSSFIRASKYVPSAIQAFARVACVRDDILQTVDQRQTIHTSVPEIKEGVIRMYKGKYHNKLVALCKGKQRSKSIHNTYFEIIKTICLLGKNEVDTEELRLRIVSLIEDPQERARKNTSFHNCLNYLPDVIEERHLDDAIYYNKDAQSISIEDPSFGLYLGLVDLDELGRSIRVRGTRYPWDISLSFAGEDRAIVEQFRSVMNDNGYSVYYDFDQQHQLWGANLREKLADVYAHEAQYMIVFLSKYYPEKDWTQFELGIGREAKGKRTDVYLLPLILDDVHVVGLSKDIGHIDLRRTTVDAAAEILINKIEDRSPTAVVQVERNEPTITAGP